MIVIGGGDTGTDCVGTSLRHGCRSLVQFEILPRPPAERAPDNPWPQWPKVYRVDYGQEEAAARFGDDPRHFCIQTKRFVGDDDGRVEGDRHGRDRVGERERPLRAARDPRHREGLAGRRWCCSRWASSAPSAAAARRSSASSSTPAATWRRARDKQTSVPGVFAAGDMRRGQTLVVWAIDEGRQAAESVDRYLRTNAAP